MKKLLYGIAMFFLVGIGVSHASEPVANKGFFACDTIPHTKENKKKITWDELPQPVKDVLQSHLYNTWTITNIYYVIKDTEYYQIDLKKGTESQTVNYDKDGKKMKSI